MQGLAPKSLALLSLSLPISQGASLPKPQDGRKELLYWPEGVADTDLRGHLDTYPHSEQEIYRHMPTERNTETER